MTLFEIELGENMVHKKTISGGSDASAGFIVGPGGKPGPKLSPNPDNQSESVQNLLSSEKAQEFIQSAMRGAMEAILASLNSAEKTGSVQKLSSGKSTPTASPSELGTSMAQVNSAGETVNVVTTEQPPSPKISTSPIPALDVVNDVPQQTVYNNTTVKQVEAGGEGSVGDTGVIDGDDISEDSEDGDEEVIEVEIDDDDADDVDSDEEEGEVDGADELPQDASYESALEPANIPLSVPNYTKPEGPSTKVCATCKYFSKKSATTGDCYAYGFVAISDYTCDSWVVSTPSTNGVDSDRIRIIENPIGQPSPIGIPPKYQSIDFYPNKLMADNAKLALQERDQRVGEERGITPYAEICARAIIQNQPLLPEMWRRIYSYYYEHQEDPKAEDWDNHGPLWQQWMAWGGDDGFAKAKVIINAMNEADEQEAEGIDLLTPAKSISKTKGKGKSSKKSLKKIEQWTAPTSIKPGGEIINGDLKAAPGSEEGLSKPNGLAADVVPELSQKHGRGKSAPGAFYLPGERVYSKSAFSLGEIIKSEYLSKQYIYSIKLIDANGIVRGTAVVHEGDLQPRSVRAIKRMQIKSIRESVESYVKQVISMLEQIENEHEDYVENPITSELLQNAEKAVNDILSNEVFADASSQMGMRKYVRAMQDIEHTLGAAVHVMQSTEELSAASTDDDSSETINETGQKNALYRIGECIDRGNECLLDEVPMRTFTARG